MLQVAVCIEAYMACPGSANRCDDIVTLDGDAPDGKHRQASKMLLDWKCTAVQLDRAEPQSYWQIVLATDVIHV